MNMQNHVSSLPLYSTQSSHPSALTKPAMTASLGLLIESQRIRMQTSTQVIASDPSASIRCLPRQSGESSSGGRQAGRLLACACMRRKPACSLRWQRTHEAGVPPSRFAKLRKFMQSWISRSNTRDSGPRQTVTTCMVSLLPWCLKSLALFWPASFSTLSPRYLVARRNRVVSGTTMVSLAWHDHA